MTEADLFTKIKPLLEGYTEGVYWDFKETTEDGAGIIKDILAFSNSDYEGDSFIIIGVKETATKNNIIKIIKLSTNDLIRLKTDYNSLYIPSKWDICGLSESQLKKIKKLSETITQKINSHMLISIPTCEFVPIQIKKTRWLFVIIIKKQVGVYISKQDIYKEKKNKNDKNNDIVVKQGVLYIRKADTTLGADSQIALAEEHIKIWKRYINWLEMPFKYSQE